MIAHSRPGPVDNTNTFSIDCMFNAFGVVGAGVLSFPGLPPGAKDVDPPSGGSEQAAGNVLQASRDQYRSNSGADIGFHHQGVCSINTLYPAYNRTPKVSNVISPG
ncbi:hypothetical protein DDZ15_02220 [Rhodohalobacter mucosus]|uniref:Uncharacterized protein n=1 Tax=Rhodohalobacter mucosus TaxID=2079485 RepID=A0A316TVB6_9BACT|nr:hypothetical protein DDZ15_02220 [Rhodohalobacter mucosus]